jgi:hypothetical protein
MAIQKVYAIRCFLLNRWRRVAGSVANAVSNFLRAIRRKRKMMEGKSRRPLVLMIGHGINSVPYLREAREAIKDANIDAAVRLYIPAFSGIGNNRNRISRLVGVPRIGSFHANMLEWDLMIFAKHTGIEALRPDVVADASKVYLSHGIESGKLLDGKNYTYESMALVDGNRPLYDVMLAKSETEVRLAKDLNPALRGMDFRIIGDALLDRLLEIKRLPLDALKRQRNLDPCRKTVLIASTWGPLSLIHKMGRQLVQEAMGLADQYQFIVSVHQQVWVERAPASRDLCCWLKEMSSASIRVISPFDDWIPWLAASDIAIVDHTSLGLYFAHLRRPIIHFAADEKCSIPGWPAYRIREFAPRLRVPGELAGLLGQVSEDYPYGELDRLNADTVAHTGRGRQLLRDQLGGLLGKRDRIG